MRKIATFGALMAAVTLSQTVAIAAESRSKNFVASAVVPESCGLDAISFVLDDNQNIARGFVNEYCNSSHGFQVLASHRMLESGEQVEVDYDGSFVSLDQSGVSSVAFRQGARFGPVPVEIRALSMTENLALSFSITAI